MSSLEKDCLWIDIIGCKRRINVDRTLADATMSLRTAPPLADHQPDPVAATFPQSLEHHAALEFTLFIQPELAWTRFHLGNHSYHCLSYVEFVD